MANNVKVLLLWGVNVELDNFEIRKDLAQPLWGAGIWCRLQIWYPGQQYVNYWTPHRLHPVKEMDCTSSLGQPADSGCHGSSGHLYHIAVLSKHRDSLLYLDLADSLLYLDLNSMGRTRSLSFMNVYLVNLMINLPLPPWGSRIFCRKSSLEGKARVTWSFLFCLWEGQHKMWGLWRKAQFCPLSLAKPIHSAPHAQKH